MQPKRVKARAPEHIEEFMPKDKILVRTTVLKPTSLPCLLTGCHGWEAVIVDHMSVEDGHTVMGKDGETITGVKLQASMCWGVEISKDQGCFPKILKTSEDLPVEDGLGGDGAGDLPDVGLENFNGWRVSFRKIQPEKIEDSDIAKRLKFKNHRVKIGRKFIKSGTLSKTLEEIKAASDLRAANRSLKNY